MNNGLVSIITPCFNGERFIAETIESVLGQNYQNWEMIIIDDGSTDNTPAIVKQYERQDPRIRYIYEPNSGSATARNKGIKDAEGQYIALLDYDDVWYPDFLQNQIGFMKQKNALCVCSSYERMNERSETIGHVTKPKPRIQLKDMYVRNHVGCLTGIYDCSKFGKVYLREELRSLRDDYAYWIDVIKLVGTAYGNPQVLAKYRTYKSSFTGNKLALVEKQYRFYRDHLKLSKAKSIYNIVAWGISGVIKFI